MSFWALIMLVGIYLLKLSDQKKISLLMANQRMEKETLLSNIIDVKSKVIENFVYDYTYWDEMGGFVKSGDPRWAKNNIDVSIPSFNVDIVWIYKTDLSVMYTTNTIEADSIKQLPLSKEDLEKIISKGPFCHFFMMTDWGVMEISGASIHPTADEERKTPPQGYFFAGCLWSEPYLKEISELTGTKIALAPLDVDQKEYAEEDLKKFTLTCAKDLNQWDGKPLVHVISQSEAVIAKTLKKQSDLQYHASIVYSIILIIFLSVILFRHVNTPLNLLFRSMAIGDAHLLKELIPQKNEFGKLAVMLKESFEHKNRLIDDIDEHKQTEEELRESEAMFRIAFEDAPTGMSIIAPDGLTYLAVNPVLCEMFGYSKEEFLGNTIRLATHPDDEARSIEWMQKKYRGEPCEPVLVQRYIHKDGHIVWGVVHTQWIRNEDGSNRMAIAHIADITKPKLAEEALQASEEKYRSIFENVQDVYCEIALDGTILEVSPSIKILSSGQYHREELVGKSMFDFYVDMADRDRVMAAMQHTGRIANYELRLRNRDGSIVICSTSMKYYYDEQGQPQKMIGSMYDITDRKKIEEQLLIKNFAVESSVSAIAFTDLGGILFYANQSYLNMWGYKDVNEVIGMHIYEFSESNTVVDNSLRILQAGKEFISEEVGRRKDGTLFNMQMTANIVRNSEGQPICMMASFIDITDRKKAENQLIIKDFAVESSVSAIGLADLEGKLFYANKAYMDMWGFDDPGEMIGTSVTDYEVDRENIKKVMAALQAGKGFIGEMQATKRDGSVFEIQMSAYIVKSSDGRSVCLMASFLDISERKRVTEVLRESEERYRSMIMNSNDLIQSVGMDGRFLYVNPTWCRVMGYNEEEVNDLNLFDIIHRDSLSHCRRLFKKIQKGENIAFIETTFAAKDGRSVFLEGNATPRLLDGKVIATQSFFHDVTERKQGEEALFVTNQRLQLLQKITESLHESLEPAVIFKRITDAIVKTMGFSTAIVLLLDENGESFHVKSLTSSRQYLSKINKTLGSPLHKLVIPVTDIIDDLKHKETAGKIIVTKHLANITHPPLSIHVSNTLEKLGNSKSFILIPLIREENLIGAIIVTSSREEIPKEDIEMLDTFALTAVQAIVNSDFLERTNRAKEQIQRSLKEKEILLRELFHRTKNNMQVISSMLRIRSRSITDPDINNIFSDLDTKILSMAVAHQKLYDSGDLSQFDLKEYFQSLVRLIMSTYSIVSGHISFLVTGDNVNVLIDTAIPCGLIINELISNSLKHAFPDNRRGTIEIKLRLSKKKELIIELSDNGIGLPGNFDLEKDSHLGLKTAIDLVEYQLQGKIDLIRKKGTMWRITLGEELYSPRV